jgi:glycosyltransferase involved in cell wall biosynthesis
MNISVIILTYNESIHIQRCLENVRHWVQDVFVVDCFSTDRTIGIAGELGAKVVQNPWPGTQAEQLNWALDNLPIKTKWVLRLDADEYLYPDLIAEIQEKLDGLAEDVTGVVFKRRHIFLGKWMKRGTYPVKLLRLFRTGKARCEQRLMDEHMVLLEGRSVEFDGDFADHNLNDIGWWTAKHNGYALREAVDLLDLEYGILGGSNAAGAAGSKGFKRGWRRWFNRGQTRLSPLVQEGSNAAGAAGSKRFKRGWRRWFKKVQTRRAPLVQEGVWGRRRRRNGRRRCGMRGCRCSGGRLRIL